MTPLAFVAGLALSLTWKREPEYPVYREDDDGIQPADPYTVIDWRYIPEAGTGYVPSYGSWFPDRSTGS